MKILLRHKETGLFWERPAHWTERAELAFDFRFVDRALDYVGQHTREEAEVALLWDTPLQVETIPLESQAVNDAGQCV